MGKSCKKDQDVTQGVLEISTEIFQDRSLNGSHSFTAHNRGLGRLLFPSSIIQPLAARLKKGLVRVCEVDGFRRKVSSYVVMKDAADVVIGSKLGLATEENISR